MVNSETANEQETALKGQGFHHWLTGTCTWMQYAIINWMLGVRAELDGLVVDPCIPSHWPGFALVRPYRGSVYHVTVENPSGLSRGVQPALITASERRLRKTMTGFHGSRSAGLGSIRFEMAKSK